MKIEYTQAQLTGVARLYQKERREYQRLNAEAEELLSEGNYAQRERVLKDAGNKWWGMQGILVAAEAVGIPEDALMKAVKAVEVEEP